MRRCVRASLAFVGLSCAVLALGCTGSPVGDPCVPEAIPDNGFSSGEVYLETSSVQCRTRTCMVFRLQGHPERIVGTPSCAAGDLTCVTQADLQRHVYCSCRCRADEGDTTTPLCPCPSGHACEEVVTTGGAGVRGSYCVPCRYTDGRVDDRGLGGEFPECPPGS